MPAPVLDSGVPGFYEMWRKQVPRQDRLSATYWPHSAALGRVRRNGDKTLKAKGLALSIVWEQKPFIS